ncbi:MAG: calcium/proton exchanger, partial [Thermomicrobiaceae bacterium]|nr:calcium/proton exchanger [Thermomicrobiaceae bacterium]
MSQLGRAERTTLGLALVGSVLAGILHLTHVSAVLVFIVAGLALAVLAAVVGQATEQVGELLGPGATGVLQSGLGNLPELFIGIFALRAGLVSVVQAALIGSILANSLLVLGLALLVGGLRHGTQRFSSESPRMIGTLTVLAVAALTIPTLARGLHQPAGAHADALSVACALVLLAVFVASIPFALSGGPGSVTTSSEPEGRAHWPLWLAAAILAVAGVAAALVSDWFVDALEPAVARLHLSHTFTGLVIVAIAGNAVENVVGIQLAARNKPDYALSVILNSSLQVALGLAPVLVLLSFVVGSAHLTLVLPGLLVAALALAAILGAMIVFDGESTWLEGAVLIGLYGIIAAAF